MAGSTSRTSERRALRRSQLPVRRIRTRTAHAVVGTPLVTPAPAAARALRCASRTAPRDGNQPSSGRLSRMLPRPISPVDLEWITRPHEHDEPARHVAELSEVAGFEHVRANVWRYEPGAKGRRHRHPVQEETFLVLQGTLSMYVGEPPERHDIPPGALITVDPGTPLQPVNHGDVDLVVYAYGYPPESEKAEILDSAV